MTPERSGADLIRTIALWMELTDKGGAPAFPYDYHAHPDLKLDLIDLSLILRQVKRGLFGVISMLTGLVLLFFNFVLGLGLLLLGPVIWVVGYTMQGGATNIDLFRKETERVLRWVQEHSLKNASCGS